MCGRFTQNTPVKILAAMFDCEELPGLLPRYNIAPTQQVTAVRVPAEGESRRLVPLRWGLIPHWAHDLSGAARMINARAETVATKPAFRSAFRHRRCLVPADGFYEWKRVEGAKQPFFIRMRNGNPFAFAGLWERWQAPDGEAIESCALLTTSASELVQPIHDRMPVILDVNDYALWLAPEVTEPTRLEPLLRPYPSDRMEAYPVSTHVNNPRHDDARCTERFTESCLQTE